MSNKKKIALLTMYYDNNYGGNLQRYALVTTLQQLGCDVECLYIRQNWSNQGLKYWIIKTLKQFVKHYILWRKNEPLFLWKVEKTEYLQMIAVTEPFYERNIPHSSVLYGKLWLKNYVRKHKNDAYIVGSDQVWRKNYVERFGLGTWFFDFLPANYSGKRIAYGASFGVDEKEYTTEDQNEIRPLFNQFTAVSVREKSGLELLKEYGWTNPQAEWVLDPALLLSGEDYSRLIGVAETQPLRGKVLCYILDMNEEKKQIIAQKCNELHSEPTIIQSGDNAVVPVEQWLRNFQDAEYVVTDSYHGLLFSLIFHKPFKLVINQSRGASRFESVKELLGINFDEPIDWVLMEQKLNKERQHSIFYLQNALNK